MVNLFDGAMLEVDSNRDLSRPELQGLGLGRWARVALHDNSMLVVHQRLLVGNIGLGANFNGFDGTPDLNLPPRKNANDDGSSVINIFGGTVSADQIVISATGQGSSYIQVWSGRVETKPYNATYDPTANGGAGSATTSANAIRLGYFRGTGGGMEIDATGELSTGELTIGHYGNGGFTVDGGDGKIQARDVVFQKFAGSTAKFLAQERDGKLTPVQATNNVVINGGKFTFQILDNLPAGSYRWDVLVADSDHDGTGKLTGRFDTVSFYAYDIPATGRVLSLVYEPTRLSVGFTYAGDGDYSGIVNFDDLLLLAKHYGQSGQQWTGGDFNADGLVNFDDLLVLAKNYNKGAPAPTDVPGASAAFNSDLAAAFAAVPDPGSATLTGIALATLVTRRRRSSRWY